MQNVFTNAAWIIACRIIQAILSLFVGMWTARYLGPSNYGLINYAASLAAFVAPIACLGISEVFVLEVVNSPDEEGEILGTSIGINILMAVICIAGIALFTQLTSPSEAETKIVCGFYSIVLLFRAVHIVQYWFQAKLLSKYTAIASVITYFVVSAIKIVLLVLQKNVFWFVGCCLLDEALIAGSNIWLYYRLGGKACVFSKRVAKRLISKSKHYIIPNLMITVFLQTDRIMLKLMVGNAFAGLYSAALTCANLSSFVFLAVIDSYRPSILLSRKENVNLFERRIRELNGFVIYMSLAQCVVMMLFSKPIIRILYGIDYINAAGVLQILVWYTLFSYLGVVRNIWVLAENKEQHLWKINVAGALINIAMNYFLIPRYNALGAAIASLFAQFFTNVVMCITFKPYRHAIWLMLEGLNPKYIFALLNEKLRKERMS